MKKIITYTAVLLLAIVTNDVNAQKGWNVSAKGAPQFSIVYNEDDYKTEDEFDYKKMINVAFGVGVGYNFSSRSGLELGVLYSLQGQKYKEQNTELKQKMNYIKLPLTYNYTFNPLDKVAIIGKLGPQLNILATSKVTDANGKTIVGDTKEFFNDVTFGAVAGIATQFSLNKQWFLTTGLRYDLDFTNAENKNHSDYPAGRKKTYNMTGGIEIGIKYAFN